MTVRVQCRRGCRSGRGCAAHATAAVRVACYSQRSLRKITKIVALIISIACDCNRVSVLPGEFGHVGEVHAVDARDQRWRERDGCPRRDLACLLDPIRRVHHVVRDIPQILLEVDSNDVLLEPLGKVDKDKGERTHRSLEVDDLAGQFVNSAGNPAISPQHLRLDLVDVIGQTHHDGGVPIDHRIEDRVPHRFGSASEKFGCIFQSRAHARQVGRLTVTHGDHEIPTNENMELAELHFFFRIEIACSPQHHEEGGSVALDLGALMCHDRVFHREFMQAELLGKRGQLLGGGAIEADPGHCPGARVERRSGVAERAGRVDAGSVLLDGVVDQAGALCTGIGRQCIGARGRNGCPSA